MRIDSGTTTEHRVRLGIFLAMCVVFAAYFGYDGVWGYPSKNLEVARQNIPVAAELKADLKTNPKVVKSELARIKPGMTEEEVKSILGEPAAVVQEPGLFAGKSNWYVGPASWAEIKFYEGTVRGAVQAHENETKSEGDIRLQKVLGAILGIFSLGMGLYYIRINTMRTVLDDSGLTAKGRHASWDQMTELDTSDFNRKGWLDVVYADAAGKTDAIRLDSYHIARFDEIVSTICERRGFASPLRPKQAEQAGEEIEERA